MKPALYYSIRTMTLYPYVVAITSEKEVRHGSKRWYGRDERHGIATHGSFSDLRGRFDTLETAEAMLKQVAELAGLYKAKRGEIELQIRQLYRDEQAALDALIGGRL